jgi:DNA-binding MarR family transcriptional regulator
MQTMRRKVIASGKRISEEATMYTTGTSSEQAVLRSLEAIMRAMREAAFEVARDLPCSRGAIPTVRLLALRGTLQVGELADLLHVDISVASRQVGQLVDDGYAERIEDPHDRRVRTLRLTPVGQALAEQLQSVVEQHMRALFAGWTPAELADAARSLDHVARSIEALTRAGTRQPV